ncbi:MAG: biopolymer transporter ExbD [bacterium]
MGAILRRLIISGGAQTVILRADKGIPLELAVKVMDRIRTAGGERILIATVREER